MEIEILVVPDCPHQRPAEERLRAALEAVGLAATGFHTRVVGDLAEAERSGFTGSPTFLINGRDPFAEPGVPASLACRMYRTADGLAGVPDTGRLREALRAAAGSGGGVQARSPSDRSSALWRRRMG
ncbi:DsbA family protein [Streptomyces sp. Da 82-17]|uniref:DsbA family protein n=1 Tax=Streptomyces sp. Da 82-17 TaxID=3377116 RepID=UPI0038D42BB4